MSNFFLELLFVGPLVAANYLLSAMLVPGAFALAFYLIAKPRSFGRTILFGSAMLVASILVFDQDAKRSVAIFLQIFIAAVLPFSIYSVIAWACVRSVQVFDRWISSKAPNAPNR